MIFQHPRRTAERCATFSGPARIPSRETCGGPSTSAATASVMTPKIQVRRHYRLGPLLPGKPVHKSRRTVVVRRKRYSAAVQTVAQQCIGRLRREWVQAIRYNSAGDARFTWRLPPSSCLAWSRQPCVAPPHTSVLSRDTAVLTRHMVSIFEPRKRRTLSLSCCWFASDRFFTASFCLLLMARPCGT